MGECFPNQRGIVDDSEVERLITQSSDGDLQAHVSFGIVVAIVAAAGSGGICRDFRNQPSPKKTDT